MSETTSREAAKAAIEAIRDYKRSRWRRPATMMVVTNPAEALRRRQAKCNAVDNARNRRAARERVRGYSPSRYRLGLEPMDMTAFDELRDELFSKGA